MLNATKKSGFSMVEILIVIAIIAGIAAVSAPIYVGAYKKKQLDALVNGIVADVRSAIAKSAAQENNNGWWIHFGNPTGSDNDFYEVCGGTYSGTPGSACSSEGGTRFSYVKLKSGLSFIDPAFGTHKVAVFTKGTGLPTAAVSLQVTSGAGSRSISVDQNGLVTYVTPSAPSVTTIAANGNTINGSANPNSASTTGWFRYVPAVDPVTCDDSFGTATAVQGPWTGTSVQPYSQLLTGLVPFTTYYFCAIAENSEGKSFDVIRSFVAS